MTHTHSPVTGLATRPAERRRHLRHVLDLDAEIAGTHVGPWPCKLRDLCRNGMHLVWETDVPKRAGHLQRDDPVQVRLRAAHLGTGQNFEVQAIVARVFEGGVGVSFRELSVESFEDLLGERNAYRLQPHLGTGGQTESYQNGVSSLASSQRINRLEAQCRALIDPWLGQVIKQFFDQVPDRLFASARDAGNNAEQRHYLDAMMVLKQQRNQLEPEIAAAVPQWAEGSAPPKERRLERAGVGAQLSLVKDNDLEHLLARAELVSQAESRHRAALYQLGQRFEALLGTRTGAGNLPVAPQVFSNAFSNALGGLGFKPTQLWATYKVLADTLVPHLGDLYKALNELLAREGILPDLGYGRSASGTQPRAPARSLGRPGQDGLQPPAFGQQGRYPERGDSDSRAYIDPEAPPSDPYQLVHSLLALQRQQQTAPAIEGDGYRGCATGSPLPLIEAAATAPEPCFHAGEIAQLLPELQCWGQHLSQDIRNRTVRERLQSELQRRVGGTQPRHMGEQEGHAIEAVTSLLNAIDDDPGCGEALKPQIRRLQLPIFKTALTDPGFFSHRSHPARRALDQLARLQTLLGRTEGKAREEREAGIERVITRVAQNFGNNKEVFADASRELDDLLATAEREYAENVATVIKECEQQQALLRSQRIETGQGLAASAAPEDPDLSLEGIGEWQVWLNLARRLRPGDALLITHGSAEPERLALAWVGQGFDPFVFVDSIGRKAASLSLRDLATRMRQGSAMTAKTSDPPIVDRALYAVAQQLHGQIGHQALHDPATGLRNRKKFLCVLGQAIGQPREPELPPTLVYLQVDGIEPLARHYGAAARDLFLKKFVALLQRRLDSRAGLAYVGDLAFAILLPPCSPEEARAMAIQLLRAITRSTVRYHSERFKIGASIGVLTLRDQTADPEALLESAFLASHAARAEGGNCIHESTLAPSPNWGAWLDQCLSADNLDLYCRRVVPLKAGTMALPHRELLPGIRYQDRIWTPPEGLEGSQDSRKLLALDRRIIGQTLSWMAGHTEQVGRLAGCTVRLSAAALSDEHLLYFVLDQLVENPTPPGKVCFEITEAAIGKHFSETQRLVHTLKEFGCQFTVAGFGKTDEGREYLSKLPMDYLKIDRLFVSDLDANPKDYALVKSANEIGHLLGLQTIAADVETQIAVERLRDIGFDYAQGPAVALLQPIAELT